MVVALWNSGPRWIPGWTWPTLRGAGLWESAQTPNTPCTAVLQGNPALLNIIRGLKQEHHPPRGPALLLAAHPGDTFPRITRHRWGDTHPGSADGVWRWRQRGIYLKKMREETRDVAYQASHLGTSSAQMRMWQQGENLHPGWSGRCETGGRLPASTTDGSKVRHSLLCRVRGTCRGYCWGGEEKRGAGGPGSRGTAVDGEGSFESG